MKTIQQLIFALILLASNQLLAANCDISLPQNKLCAEIHWLIGPSVDTENKLELQFYNEAMTSTIEPQKKVTVSLYMPDMGHGSGPTTISRPTNPDGNAIPGYFNVSKIYFMMGGDWELRLALKSADGKTETGVAQIHL